MNKAALLKQIIARLNENLETLTKAARASHAEATHESSRAENKYDTRGLEAAYLAGGQARQAKETIDAIEVYADLPILNFAARDPIDVTAVVELEADGTRSTYFIGPKGGGLEIEHEGKEIMVITPQSPLGQILIGKKANARWTAKVGGAAVKYCVVAVG